MTVFFSVPVFTLCQILLYSRDLYSTSVFTAVGIVAAYAIHRLFLARKMHKFTATASSAVHLVNTALVVLLCLSVGRRSSGSTLVTFRVDTYFPSLLFVSALLWMFVYDTRDFVSDKQVCSAFILFSCTMHSNIDRCLYRLHSACISFLLLFYLFLCQSNFMETLLLL